MKSERPVPPTLPPKKGKSAPTKLKIRLVDAAELRGRSLDWQEFGNIGVHTQFSAIPPSEIWISNTVPRYERRLLLVGARAQLEAANQLGYNSSDAYEYGLSVERAERERDVRSGGDRPHHDEVLQGIYKGKWKDIVDINGEKLAVWIVDGVLVRNTTKSDWVLAGHAFVYPFTPADEIWLEDQVAEDERDFILLHEQTERRLMKHEEMDYDDAHAEASKIEMAARKGAGAASRGKVSHRWRGGRKSMSENGNSSSQTTQEKPKPLPPQTQETPSKPSRTPQNRSELPQPPTVPPQRMETLPEPSAQTSPTTEQEVSSEQQIPIQEHNPLPTIKKGKRQEIEELYERIRRPDGGFTYNVRSSKQPRQGYALSPYADRSFAKPVAELSLKDMVQYLVRNRDLLKTRNHYLGAWHDPETGKVFLDVSVVADDEESARELALKHDQIAYFDLGKGVSVTVNRAATSGGAAKGISNGRTKETSAALGPRRFDTGGRDGILPPTDGAGAHGARVAGSQGGVGAVAAKGLKGQAEAPSQPSQPKKDSSEGTPPPRQEPSKPSMGKNPTGSQQVTPPFDPSQFPPMPQPTQLPPPRLDEQRGATESAWERWRATRSEAPEPLQATPAFNQPRPKAYLTAEVRSYAKDVLGIEPTEDDYFALAGGQEGLYPSVSLADYDSKGGIQIGAYGSEFSTTLTIRKDENNGNLVVYYGGIFARGDTRGGTTAPKVLASQLQHLKHMGVQQVKCLACRDDRADTVGYKVWPKMGFDGVIDEWVGKDLPPEFRQAKTIQELYATPGGKKAWEEFGRSIWLSLDLQSPQADKMFALIAKMQKRRGAKALADDEDTFAWEGNLYPPNYKEFERQFEEERKRKEQEKNGEQGAKSLTEHQYGCLMLLLPLDLRKQINDWQLENIPDFHLAPEGYDFRSHVTVLYGFKISDEETVQTLRALLMRCGPVPIRLTKVSLFTGGKDGDVLKVDVESPLLHELNGIIRDGFDVETKYPTYLPHITLAHLRSETSHLYAGMDAPFLGRDVILDRAEYAYPDGTKEEISLSFLQQFKDVPRPNVPNRHRERIVESILVRTKAQPSESAPPPPQPKASPAPKKQEKPKQEKPKQEKPKQQPPKVPEPYFHEARQDRFGDTGASPPYVELVAVPPVLEVRENQRTPMEATTPRPEDAPVPIEEEIGRATAEMGEPPPDERPPVERLKSLASSPARVKRVLGEKRRRSAMKRIYLIETEDGTRGVFKKGVDEVGIGDAGSRVGIQRGTAYRREAAAYVVAEALGFGDLVPATALREEDGDEGSMQQFVSAPTPMRGGKPDSKLMLIDNGLSFPVAYHEMDVANILLMSRAVYKDLPMPDVSKMRNQWFKVKRQLQDLGIEDDAIKLMEQRFRAVAYGKHRRVGDLPDLLDPKKTLRATMDDYVLRGDAEEGSRLKKTIEEDDKSFDSPEGVARAAVFDYICGNLDRNSGNWLLVG